MTVPAQTSPRTSQHTRLATSHSALIVPDSLDESPTLRSPAYLVLTAQSLVSLRQTPKCLRVILTAEGDLALIPPMSFYWEMLTMTAQKRTLFPFRVFRSRTL